jgi:S1-C subfamily serine protease
LVEKDTLTAAHVLRRYKPKSGQLTATFHQRDKNGAGLWFDIVEIEENRDLALCKIENFSVAKEPPRKPDAKRPWSSYRQVTSLEVSKTLPSPGELIAIIGYPLGSFASPVVQMGNIGATDALLNVVPPFPAGRCDLLIVSASGNHGDSGCPVISLRTGEVLGVIDQYVPAPLLTVNGQAIPQQSGLMVALPSQWVLDILNRHHVKMAPITFKEDMVF